jgi:hypothetical protein
MPASHGKPAVAACIADKASKWQGSIHLQCAACKCNGIGKRASMCSTIARAQMRKCCRAILHVRAAVLQDSSLPRTSGSRLPATRFAACTSTTAANASTAGSTSTAGAYASVGSAPGLQSATLRLHIVALRLRIVASCKGGPTIGTGVKGCACVGRLGRPGIHDGLGSVLDI